MKSIKPCWIIIITEMSSHIPWLMDRLHVLFTDDPSKEDWLDSFQLCDPRKTFTADLCDACKTDVTVLTCGEDVHVVSKDEVAIGKLMLFLHDGGCHCQGTSKKQLNFSLLDAIAASGSMAALRHCISYCRKNIDLRSATESSEKRKDFNKTSLAYLCPESSSELKRTHFSKDVTFRQSNDPNEDLLTFSEDGASSHPNYAQCSDKQQGWQRILLSPNCGGGYGERERFSVDFANALENAITNYNHDSPSSSDSSEFATNRSKEEFGKTFDSTVLHEYREGKECNARSLEMCPKSAPVFCAGEERNNFTPIDFTSAWYLQNLKPEAQPETTILTSNTEIQNKSQHCRVPLYGENECPFACCFPCSEVEYLRQHVDQTSILSMAVHALCYNHGSMMVCARALNTAAISELVRLSGSLPTTGACLYLYFLSNEDKETFSEVALDDLFLLHERTLRMEVSQLCQLAWSDHPVTDSFVRARQTTLQIALCHRCELNQFPDRESYGKTARAKFRLSYHDNASLFTCIENGGCPCPDSVYKQTQIVMPEIAAVASGNFSMVRALTKSWFSSQTPDIDKRASSSKDRKYPRKSCSKTPNSIRRPGVSVDFASQVQHYGESNVGLLLRHSLYAGYDEIIHYILENMGCWSLSGEETMACLRMCMLTGRDDLFYLLSMRAGNESTLARTCRAGSPLMMAASFGRNLLVNLLLARGANPCLGNCNGYTAVEMALDSNYKDSEMIALRMLTAALEPINLKRCIESALYSRKFQVARYLISQGVYTAYDEGRRFWTRHTDTPREIPLISWWLRGSVHGGCDDVLAFLLKEGLDVNARDSTRNTTALHLAVQRLMDSSVVESLLASGAKLNAKDGFGLSPLFYTVEKNQTVNFGILMKGGASVNDVDAFFNTALKNRRFQVVLFLLHAGYLLSPANVDQLKQLGPRVPEPLQVLISTVRSETPSLPILCALSLRESFGDRLNPYLESVGCPDVVKRFVRLEHLAHRFLDIDNWNKILSWNEPLI